MTFGLSNIESQSFLLVYLTLQNAVSTNWQMMFVLCVLTNCFSMLRYQGIGLKGPVGDWVKTHCVVPTTAASDIHTASSNDTSSANLLENRVDGYSGDCVLDGCDGRIKRVR